jgi:hypothetical protein
VDDLTGKRKSGLIWIDLIVALSAITISVASLWVAVRASNTQERLLSASVWPSLEYGTSNIAPTGAPRVDFILQNVGVGPARVRWLALYYGDKAYPDARSALAACCGAHGSLPTTTHGLQEDVLTATQAVPFITLPKTTSDTAVFNALNGVRHRFYVRTCYCSVLDDCWFFDSRRKLPDRVKACPAAETPLFQG